MSAFNRSQAVFSSRTQRILRCGTALPLLLAAWPALANPIVESSASDIVVDADSATGTPLAVDLRTTGGSISAVVDTVTATATTGQRGEVINLETSNGAITSSFGSVVLTGDGAVRGVRADSQGGDIDVHVGQFTLDGAITSGVIAHSVTGDVVVKGDNVLVRGTGSDPSTGFYPEALFAQSEQAAATVIAGSVETRGSNGSAAVAIAGTDASITVQSATAHSANATTLYADGRDSATVDAGTVAMLANGDGIDAYSSAGLVTVNADSVSSLGGGIYGKGAAVSLSADKVDAVRFGLHGQSDTAGAVNLSVTDTVSVAGGTGTALRARTTGNVTIAAANVSVTGAGTDPGVRPDGMRIDQGGIVVQGEGGNGSIAIDAGNVTVGGEYRYGITARGNGAISIAADNVTLASADSVGVVARGGAGDVSITTGTVTTTGASGVGVVASTTTGDIVIKAGTTRAENTGFVGNFTGDAVVATSDSGAISITSDNAYSAGLFGTALAGISAGDVTIASRLASTSGNQGVAVYGSTVGGMLRIAADQITTSGSGAQAITATAETGAIDIDVGTITATGSNATGMFVRLGGGGTNIDIGSISSAGTGLTLQARIPGALASTVNVTGNVVSGVRAINIASQSANAVPASPNATFNIAAGASVVGTSAIGLTATINNGTALPAPLRSGSVFVNNNGTLTGTAGTALALQQTNAFVINNGTITGNVNAGGGVIQNRGTINGSVNLLAQVGSPLSVFAYEGASTGVTGTITGGQAVDTFGQIFRTSGTAIIGGGLPTAFDRYGVLTDTVSGVTVVVETAANPVGATPSLFLLGGGSIVNRANLSGTVIPAANGAPALFVPALYSYGFASVATPFGQRFVFEGAGIGSASFTNEASINGRIALTTANFVNSGSIQRSSASVPSVITARAGEGFTFVNTGSISMVDGGARVRTAANGNPFNDFNPYDLPEPALTIRSAVTGSLDSAGLYVPVAISNFGAIDGGLLTRMTASTFAFENTGTITGFNGADSAPGLAIALGLNYDAGAGSQASFEPVATVATQVATLTNRGSIRDGLVARLAANAATLTNSGSIAGNAAEPAAIDYEQGLNSDDAAAASFAFVNSGSIDGNASFELETIATSITNNGTITGREFAVTAQTFPDMMFGGEVALEIDNESDLSNSLTFTNTGTIATTGHAATAVSIEVEAGQLDTAELATSNARVAVVNSGTISAKGGATIVTQQFAPFLAPGQFLVNSMAGLSVDAGDVGGQSLITIDNQAGGLIEAGGAISVLNPNGYFPVPNPVDGAAVVALAAKGKTIEITNAGTIRGGSGTIPSPNAVPTRGVAHDNYLAGAIQTAGDDVDDGEAYVASIDRLINAASGKIIGSIDLGGNDDRIDNAGSIAGNVFLRSGNDVVVNSGTIDGTLNLGDGNDVLELTASSIITNAVDLGAGDDAVVLRGGAALGQVAASVNAELLDVVSGSWRAAATNSEFDTVRIASGARLAVGEDAIGQATISTSHIQLGGRLDLDFASDTHPGAFGDVLVDGAGSVHLVGESTVLFDDTAGLQFTGGTFVENGELLLTTVFDGDITTSGDGVFELGATGDFTGNLVNNGTFVFARDTDYSFAGDFTGSGLLKKFGAGTLAFDGLYDFDGVTSIAGGLVKFTGQLAADTEVALNPGGTLDLSGIASGEQTIAELEGQGGKLSLGQTDLVIEQDTNTVFSGEITGTGTIQKDGEGDLKLNGDGSTFTGTGEVDGGTLSVNGNFSNANFVVNDGGTLGGAGTIGATAVKGGTLAPGNSIDTLTVNGNISFTSASVFEVEANAAGAADRLNATGTATLGGARVEVIAANGTYRPLTDYTILTAAGGVSGTFASVHDNLAFLDPSLIYSANAVTLRLVRNDIDFAAFGTTANQVAVGTLIESLGYGNALYNQTLLLADGTVAPSFASLTGEVYPAYSAGMVETAEMLRRQTAAPATGDGTFVWATGLYHDIDSGSSVGSVKLQGKGAAGGFGYGANGFVASAGIGHVEQESDGNLTDGATTFVIGRAGYNSPSGLSLAAGAQFGWSDASTRRQTTLGAINQAVTGQIDGDYLQVFGDIGYAFPLGAAYSVEPFAGVSHLSLKLDNVVETGASTALQVGAIERDLTFGRVGVRVSADRSAGIRPYASAAYRHAWGDRDSRATFGFVGTTATASFGALPIARSAAELSAGLRITQGAVDFDLAYDGALSDQFDSHGLRAGIKFSF